MTQIRNIQKACAVFLVAELFVPIFVINSDEYSIIGTLSASNLAWMYIVQLGILALFLFIRHSKVIDELSLIIVSTTLMGIICMKFSLIVEVGRNYDIPLNELSCREYLTIDLQILVGFFLLASDILYCIKKRKQCGNT